MTERNVAGVQRNSAKPRNRSELIASAKTATIINKDNIICLKKRIRVIYHNGRGFQNLLEQAGYTMDTIHQSLKPSKNRDMVFKAGLGAGKSGSFFFFSHDCQFIIKTVKDEEFKVLMRMLPDYLEHLKQNPTSLLAKIVGIFTIKTEALDKTTILLMENTLKLTDKDDLQHVFDLKGSLAKRYVPTDEKTKPSSTLKDLNLLEISAKRPDMISFPPYARIPCMKAVKKDLKLLRKYNLMDYSLLLAIEEKKDKIPYMLTKK